MHKLATTLSFLSLAMLVNLCGQAAHAADRNFTAAAQGAKGRTSSATGQGAQGVGARVTSNPTGKQISRFLPYAGFGGIASRQFGLPQTNLDSFVAQAGGQAELIYGDEGDYGPPPYEYFTPDHYINTGIVDGGLTTGHASDLPSAWGWPN